MQLDEDFMATYQLSYGFNPDGTVNENPLKFDDEKEEEEEARAAEELKQKLENENAKAAKKKPSKHKIFTMYYSVSVWQHPAN